MSKVAEKIDSLDVGEKLKNMEKGLTDLVDEKNRNATKTTCDTFEKRLMLPSLLLELLQENLKEIEIIKTR